MATASDTRAKSAHGVDTHVGRRVRELRKALRLSQQDLARHLDLTFQQVQKYERGLNRISASKLYEIAQVLRVPVAYFFDGYDADEAASSGIGLQSEVNAFLQTAEGVELAHSFLGLRSSDLRKTIMQLLQAMGKVE